jgi:hypothetical protein
MRTRLALAATAAGLCLLSAGAATPALAAPSAPSAAPAALRAHAAAPSATLTKLTGTTASIAITDAVQNAQITITDGRSTSVTRKYYVPGSTLTVPVPVSEGTQFDFSVTQSVDGDESAAATVHVDTRVTSIAEPVIEKTYVTPGLSYEKGVLIVRGAPFLSIELTNAFGQVIGSGAPKADGAASVGWKMPFDSVDPRIYVRQTFGDVASPTASLRVDGSTAAEDLQPPHVDISETASTTSVTAHRTGDTDVASLVVCDANGVTLTSARFRGDTAVVTLPRPASARLIRVYMTEKDDVGKFRSSLAEQFELSSDQGSIKPDAPVVDDAHMVGTRAVADIDALPGAIVTVRNARDEVVAVRIAGSSGDLSILIPSGRTGVDYTVTQTTGSYASEARPFEVAS